MLPGLNAVLSVLSGIRDKAETIVLERRCRMQGISESRGWEKRLSVVTCGCFAAGMGGVAQLFIGCNIGEDCE